MHVESIIIAISVINLFALIVGAFSFATICPLISKKKASNLASKEDIGQITIFVENVKAQYMAELEKVRATLVSEGQGRGKATPCL